MSEGRAGVAGGVGEMTVAGRYRLVAPVGSGGMGRVWRAHDELLDREVAVKELVVPAGMSVADRRAAQLRTERKARTAARVDHPAVVRIYDVLRATGRSWIVMKYVRSRSLHIRVSQDGPLTHSEAARVGVALLEALQAAHAAGVLHRDVKPHNVLIGPDGRVVLTDFGLATLSVAPARDSGLTFGATYAEPLIGSPHYVAPERLSDGISSVPADLWSLGATIYFAVEGRPPFSRPSVGESLAALLTHAPDLPQHAGPLHPVIARLLATDPADRFTADEALTALRIVSRRAVGVFAVPVRRAEMDPVRFRPARVLAVTGAASDPQPRSAQVRESVRSGAGRRVWRIRLAVGVAVAAIAAISAAAAAGGIRDSGSSAAPAPSSSAAVPAGGACAGATPQPVIEALTEAPVSLPDGWLWHVDRAGFSLPSPRGWTRATDAGVVCFSDPDGVRTFTVDAGMSTTGQPLQFWQAAERAALADNTLPGYRKISLGVLLVLGGGADWEYSWRPPTGPPLHTRRVLLAAGAAHSYRLSWTTRDQDWALKLVHQRTFIDGFRSPWTAASTWAVRPPPPS
jgi:hypothetical protein